MAKNTQYPTYNVLSQKDEWDDHTQKIVLARTVREHNYDFLTLLEAEMLRAICSLLVDDNRGDIIQYVLCHIDQTLHQSIGESERKAGVPKASILIREGLKAIEHMVQIKYVKPFIELEEIDHKRILHDLSQSKLQFIDENVNIPQKALFSKLLNLTVESYCSHPAVWSEIGYGGPAYPRGYVRTQEGQLDPWEAKKQS